MKNLKSSNYFIHSLADVQSNKIGDNTNVWQFVVILPKAIIGSNCNICCNAFIENNVKIGNNVTVKSGVYIWDGTTIKDNVFIGPCVVFTNDLRPRSKNHLGVTTKIILNEGCSIGANSTILTGVKIGKFAMTGIGSVVTKNVLDYELVFGNPAKHKGWVDEVGNKLIPFEKSLWKSNNGEMFKLTKTGMKKI
jgi:acetyltransferase-like isoleucine patch superfamily enzyme